MAAAGDMSVQVLRCLQSVAAALAGKGFDNRYWTVEVREALCRLGTKHGYKVAARGARSRDFGEWLYDVTWLDYELSDRDVPKQLRKLALVVECEWGNAGDIDDDFEKLLTARAELRVLIFEQGNEEKTLSVCKRLQAMEARFDMRGSEDHYLLAGYDRNASRFRGRVLAGGVLSPLDINAIPPIKRPQSRSSRAGPS